MSTGHILDKMSGMSDFFKLQRGFLQDQQELISKQIARLYEFELSMSSGSAVQNAPNHSPLKVVPPKISDAVVVSNTKVNQRVI